jgi:hypothetical protein
VLSHCYHHIKRRLTTEIKKALMIAHQGFCDLQLYAVEKSYYNPLPARGRKNFWLKN